MTGFIQQCVDLYLEISGMTYADLNRNAQVPWLAGRTIKQEEIEPRGQLRAVASNMLMKFLYAARVVRYGLLFSVARLARDTHR